MGCSSKGARRAATHDYRLGITADDPVDCTAPLAVDHTPATFNAGPQPSDGGTVAISLRFANAAETADVILVEYATRCCGGGLRCVGVRQYVTTAEGRAQIDEEGSYISDTILMGSSAPLYEIRIANLAGVVERIRTWSY